MRHLLLVDPDRAVCDAFRKHFFPWVWQTVPPTPTGPLVDIRNGYLADQGADAFATAGNSFGLMDGGVDLAVARYDIHVEARVQKAIRRHYRGEIPVGQCLVVPFSLGLNYRHLLYAPTMRVPTSIAMTDAVYRATWATFLATQDHRINDLAMPAFGTLTGRVSPDEAARQMALAWRNFHDNRYAYVPPTWAAAEVRHREIMGTRQDTLL
jgi:O-acetyl-ADP-ribose deacetylase (regulator of RNase III)